MVRFNTATSSAGCSRIANSSNFSGMGNHFTLRRNRRARGVCKFSAHEFVALKCPEPPRTGLSPTQFSGHEARDRLEECLHFAAPFFRKIEPELSVVL